MPQLIKGANAPLSTGGRSPHRVLVGISWQIPTTSPEPFEVDLSILLCDSPAHLPNPDHVVFASQLQAPASQELTLGAAPLDLDLGGSSTTPVSTRDTEEIEVDLTRVPAHINGLVFVLTIASALSRRQSAQDLRGVVLRVGELPSGMEIASYPVDVTGDESTALALGEIYRRIAPDGTFQWKLRALGQGSDQGLAGLVAAFGVTT